MDKAQHHKSPYVDFDRFESNLFIDDFVHPIDSISINAARTKTAKFKAKAYRLNAAIFEVSRNKFKKSSGFEKMRANFSR